MLFDEAKLYENIRKIFREEINSLNQPKDKLYSIEETCQLFGISKTTYHNWRTQGKINPRSIGGKRYLTQQDIDNIKNDQTKR